MDSPDEKSHANDLSLQGNREFGMRVFVRERSQMTERAAGTMSREDKGPVVPPPTLNGALGTIAEAVADWPGVIATAHWDLFRPPLIDGVDFYFEEEELGHVHLDGSVHLATSRALCNALVAEGLAQPWPYHRGWVHAQVQRIGPNAVIALFRRNYERLLQAH
jgi:hypothetical protein